MEIHQVDLLKHDSIYIIPISDTHIGDKLFNEAKLVSYIEWVKDTPNARIILLGDIMNTATKESVSDSYSETMSPNEQLKYAQQLFEPVKDKILAATDGNHERRVTKSTSINMVEILSNHLGCYYRPDGLFIKFRVGKQANGKPVVYTLYATHGFGGGKKPGGKANNLQSLSQIVLSDIYCMSHVHQQMTFQDIYYVPDIRTNEVNAVKRTYVMSGSFLGWGGYAEQMGFPPSKIGTPRIRLDGTRKDVHVSI